MQAVTLIDFDKHTLRFKIWPSPLEPSVLTLIMTILPLVTKSLMHRGGEPLVFASTENLRAETAGSSAKNASRRKLTVRMAMYVIQIEYGLGCRQDEWGSDGRINWRWRRQEVRKGSWIYWYFFFFFFKNGLLWIVYFFFFVLKWQEFCYVFFEFSIMDLGTIPFVVTTTTVIVWKTNKTKFPLEVKMN